MFAATLQYMHKDPKSTNPADYRAAFEMLKKIRPYITQFNSSGYINDLVGDDVCVALGWSGDVGIASIARTEAKQALVQDRVLDPEGRRAGVVRRDGDPERREASWKPR